MRHPRSWPGALATAGLLGSVVVPGMGHAQAAAPDTAAAAATAAAVDPPAGEVTFSWSPFSLHYSPSDDHKPSVAAGFRRALGGPGFAGGAFFTNSFGQPSAYAFYGQRYHGGIPSQPRVFVEWSVGLMYGYVRDRADEVPLNVRGFSPVFLLSPGWQLTPRSSVQLNLAGTAAIMLQFNHRID